MKSVFSAAFVCVLSTLSLRANPIVTVEETSVSPVETAHIKVMKPDNSGVFYDGNVLAGINNLLVDGVATTGFCIDPFHFSLGGPVPNYEVVDLTQAPKDANMDAQQAALVRALWTLNFDAIGTDNQKAAALQIAIWEVVAGPRFSLPNGQTDFGAASLTLLAENYNGPMVNLVALTGSGQDYVIAAPSVPDAGTTLLLFTIGIGVILLAQRIDHSSRYA
ncbi:MAG: VPDSG-CTERM sorting domain-containing protein, partial [Chthoniobacterales bacterium]